MPTPKKLGSKPNPLKRFMTYLWHHPKELVAFLILLALIILPLSLWITSVRNNHAKSTAIAKERAQFTQAEKDVATTADSIKVGFQQPNGEQKLNYCDRASTNEFGGGELYCDVSFSLAFAAQNLQQAQIITNRLVSFNHIGTYLAKDLSTSGASFPPVNLGSIDYTDKNSGLNCTDTYTYYEDELEQHDYSNFKNINNGRLLIVDMTCGKRPVKAAYY